MKKHYTLLFLLFTFWSQAQNGITYQALILNPNSEELPGTDNSRLPMINQSICLDFKIINAASQVDYQETLNTNTDEFGMVNVIIGTGTRKAGIATQFKNINWDGTAKNLVVSFDPTGNCNQFIEISNQPFTYVPYALYAANGGATGPAGPAGTNGLDGKTVLNGTTNPSTSLGTNGDFYINTTNNSLFGPKANGLWGNGVALVGPQGIQGLQGPQGVAGINGLSAYQIWLNAGNTGTEAQFLTALRGANGAQGIQGLQGIQGATGLTGATGATGPQGIAGINGINGLSAYQTWLNAGNTGTEAQFLTSIRGATGAQGPQGIAGTNGTNGLSAYQIWLNEGNTGTEAQFLTALSSGPQGIQGVAGPTGSTGPQGPTGPAGSNGQNGLSAYQIWLNAGNSGTEAQFLTALRGATGAQGIQGVAGPTGSTGSSGTNGVDGKTILNGIQDPVNSVGNNGDFYINTTANSLFGPKTSGAWGNGLSLVGPQGATGINGKNTLVTTTVEAAGANCVTGGTKIEVGLDANNNDVLDIGEVNSSLTKYVCNGLNSNNVGGSNNSVHGMVTLNSIGQSTNWIVPNDVYIIEVYVNGSIGGKGGDALYVGCGGIEKRGGNGGIYGSAKVNLNVVPGDIITYYLGLNGTPGNDACNYGYGAIAMNGVAGETTFIYKNSVLGMRIVGGNGGTRAVSGGNGTAGSNGFLDMSGLLNNGFFAEEKINPYSDQKQTILIRY